MKRNTLLYASLAALFATPAFAAVPTYTEVEL